jgi:phage terminase large subunit-like protein
MLLMGLRLGLHSRGIFTTTPRPLPFIKALVKRPDVIKVFGTTYENLSNLSSNFREQIRQYEGTRLGRQELDAEILEDVPGALWTPSMLEATRVRFAPKDLERVVIGWDPAMTSGEEADEHGIVVMGVDNQKPDAHIYLLEDASGNLTPHEAARRVVSIYHAWNADLVVGEANQGGDMLESLLRVVDRNINFVKVHARRGKYVRAEPVASLWERGLAHIVGRMDAFEDEAVAFTPDQGGSSEGYSPNRVDAVVWAATQLCVQPGRASLIWG